MRKRFVVASLVVLSAALAAACTKSATAPQQVVGGHTYTIVASGSSSSGSGGGGYGYSSTSGQFFFSPVPDTVKVDSTVTFRFHDVTHTVTFDGMPTGANVKNIAAGTNADSTRAFLVAGTYTWHCSIHTYMHGTLVVE